MNHFNSRPRMRANLWGCSIDYLLGQFQLPPSHEGERRISIVPCTCFEFQLPPSHEGEPGHGHGVGGRTDDLNSRPRMRANVCGKCTPSCLRKFQLPPSHEGEPPVPGDEVAFIHFNSRPRMRANAAILGAGIQLADFNSRPRMRANHRGR